MPILAVADSLLAALCILNALWERGRGATRPSPGAFVTDASSARMAMLYPSVWLLLSLILALLAVQEAWATRMGHGSG